MRRVVITGLGVLAPNGNGKDAYWQACVNGVSGADYITAFDASGYTSHIACEIKGFEPGEHGVTEDEVRRLDRHAVFAIACGNEAIEDARLDLADVDRERAGVYVGSTNGPPVTFEGVWEAVTNKGAERMAGKQLPPDFYSGVMASASASAVALHHGFMGPRAVISDACSSGVNALDMARQAIIEDACDVALAGGSDASITPMGLDCYCVLGAVSRRNDNPQAASRPFERDRDGFVLAEGAAMVVLEELEHARKRGASIYGEILSVATNTNAYHMTGLPGGGEPLAAAIDTALKRAGVKHEDVGYLNAHGTATPVNDRSETNAIKHAFGELAWKLPISSTKCMIGHTQGAASAHQAVVLCMTLRDQLLHPTTNYENPDPECDLDYVPNVAREASVDIALANACGFGGINSTVVLRRWGSDA